MSRPRWTIGIFAASAISSQTSTDRFARRQHVARLLAGDRDEAEVPDRSAVGLRVPVDHDDALSPPGCGERMG